jgi:argininosuccinate lyase
MSIIRGRFSKEADKKVIQYSESLSYDSRLYPYDIKGSLAHVKMLAKQNIIPKEDADKITKGLIEIKDELDNGIFVFNEELEDIHISIESRLKELIGDSAGRLHTARSRNDQIALDMRLYVRDKTKDAIQAITDLEKVIVEQAEKNKETIMPGYTHTQLAQPILLAHHLLAYFEMFERDKARFADSYKRTDVMPLGSAALSGSPYNVDREFVAKELGFESVTQNSMDAVSDRDFVIEYLSNAAITMMHLSRMAEEIVLWSTSEFGFMTLDDAYTTGSSIMPQKKNSDVAELGRGKTGRVYGNLQRMLVTMKGLPLSYNRDLQEDKEGLFDTVDTLLLSLEVFTGMLETAEYNTENMSRSLKNDIILATDIADYLVKKGLPFRDAHRIVGNIVNYATTNNMNLMDINLEKYKEFCELFEADVKDISVESSIKSKNVIGGTAPEQIEYQLKRARKLLD